jgi:FKBP-type peptidyl-prolyl cis-trans isomerase
MAQVQPSPSSGRSRSALWLAGGALLLAYAPAGFGKVLMVGKDHRPITSGLTPGVKVVRLKDGLQYQDLVVGHGRVAKSGETVRILYVGMVQNGGGFDASVRHGGPVSFVVGRAGGVVMGLNEGVAGVRVGGERKLIVPPALGYGAQGLRPSVPPNSTLVYTVDLVGVK